MSSLWFVDFGMRLCELIPLHSTSWGPALVGGHVANPHRSAFQMAAYKSSQNYCVIKKQMAISCPHAAFSHSFLFSGEGKNEFLNRVRRTIEAYKSQDPLLCHELRLTAQC